MPDTNCSSEFQPEFQPGLRPVGATWRDWLLPVAIGVLLSVCWAIYAWPELSRLILPDADDMVRLAQVRDWLNGQALNDWTQYRMAPPDGAPMHWSRINDFGVAALILLADLLVGRATAELFAVLVYPTLLLLVSIYLSVRIAARLWSREAAMVAGILAAIAFPGITVFMPGRIDHHGLQAVLVQAMVLALMARPGVHSGLGAGLAMAVGMMIGLETVPQYAALIGVMALLWIVAGAAERARLGGFALALGGVTTLFLVTMRPTYWTAGLCDAFTPASATGLLAGSAALGLLSAATPWLRSWPVRLAAAVLLGGAAVAGTLLAYPACLTGPYGAVSPFLRDNFITNIDEANGIFAQNSLARAISLIGVIVAASAALLWRARRDPTHWRRWAPIAAVVWGSAVVTLFQLRGVYIGVPLAGAALSGVVIRARAATGHWRVPALVLAWVGSAGIAYYQIPSAIERVLLGVDTVRGQTMPQQICKSGDVWRYLNRYPAGTIMAPTNMASYLLGATHHRTVGAGYHRNDAANMDMYRYFLGPIAQAEAIGRRRGVDYVLFCPGDLAESNLVGRYPHGIAALLTARRTPPGMTRLPLPGSTMLFFRVDH